MTSCVCGGVGDLAGEADGGEEVEAAQEADPGALGPRMTLEPEGTKDRGARRGGGGGPDKRGDGAGG